LGHELHSYPVLIRKSMLQRLLISHYALLEHLEMDLTEGLTTITGETGAGKSILLGAIGLILGQRADTSVVSEGFDKCIIEGHFDIRRLPLQSFFDQHDLDYSETCIFRREIAKTGKSRAFINDTPVTLPLLKELGSFLVEIQTQHTTLMMAQVDVQREMLDSFTTESGVYPEYQRTYTKVLEISKELKTAESTLRLALKERDFNRFQLQEIDVLQLFSGEETSLEQEIQTLSQAEEIKDHFAQVASGLSEGDLNVRGLVQQLYQAIKGFETISPAFADFKNRLKSIAIEVDDLAAEAAQIAEKTEQNPQRLFEINDRFDKIQHLFRKHQVSTTDELLEIAQKLSNTLSSTTELEALIVQLQESLIEWQNTCETNAQLLHTQRMQAAEILSTQSVDILKRLNMPYTQVAFDIQFDLSQMGPHGADVIRLLFTANPGTQPQPVSEIASGGELSRLNFAFRSIISERKLLPTLIYDEADTGVSGEVAAKMGQLFRELAQRHQILCISHLPQVAAAGNQQWEVVKMQDAQTTRSEVRLLSEADRQISIAKMLSGAEMTEAALSHAAHLLSGH
jgi:DNA repair protein RecN (Recombination protein N)